jgi:hypothetical protein
VQTTPRKNKNISIGGLFNIIEAIYNKYSWRIQQNNTDIRWRWHPPKLKFTYLIYAANQQSLS